MRGSIFRTIKLLILVNIFLIPFIVAVQNIAIRFIIGLFIGFSFILLLSFSSKMQSLYKKKIIKEMKKGISRFLPINAFSIDSLE